MPEIRNHHRLQKHDAPFDAWKIHTGDHTEIVRVRLAPGEMIDHHVNPVTVFFYVLEGQGELTIDEEQLQMAKDDSVRVEQGLNRRWENTGIEPLEVLVIKQL